MSDSLSAISAVQAATLWKSTSKSPPPGTLPLPECDGTGGPEDFTKSTIVQQSSFLFILSIFFVSSACISCYNESLDISFLFSSSIYLVFISSLWPPAPLNGTVIALGVVLYIPHHQSPSPNHQP